MLGNTEKRFIEYIDSIEVVVDDEVVVDAVNQDIWGQIEGEDHITLDNFDDVGLWFTHNDDEPWMQIYFDKNGVELTMSVSPKVLQEWVSLIAKNKEWTEKYL